MLALELVIVAAVVALAVGLVVAVARGGRTRSGAGVGSGALAGILAFGLVACLGAAFLMLFAFPDGSPLAGLYPPQCNTGKRAALTEFPHYGGASPELWDVDGGCTGHLPFSGDLADARAYYEERLAEEGWSVETHGPGDHWVGVLVSAVRGGYRYVVTYEPPPTPPPGPSPGATDPEEEGDARRRLTLYLLDR